MYGTMRHWPPERFRAMLQSFFTVSSVWVLTMHLVNGLITRGVLTNFGACLPVVFVAMLAGHRISRSLPVDRFIAIVHVVLLLLAVFLLVGVFSAGGT